MTDKLPPNLLALFAPRPPLRWVPPCDHAPEERKTANISGIAAYLPTLESYKDEYEYHPTMSWLERRDQKKLECKAKMEQLMMEGPKNYRPNEDPNIRGDAFKTLIVARLSYEANEQDLEHEFGRYGPIERIRLITDTHTHEKGNKKRKPHRGYAFVVFEREKDMRAALDACDGIRIKDRYVKVDVERGRTVKGWKPSRLGGGLGGRGYTKAMPSQPVGPGRFGSGFRGGFRSGFGGRDRGSFRSGGVNFNDRGFRGGPSGGGSRGDRNFGNGSNGSAPPHAPNGPGGYSGRDGRREYSGTGGGYGRDGAGRSSYDDRPGGSYRDRDDRGGRDYGGRDRDARRTGSNMEPIRPRDGYGGHGGRDYDRRRDDDSRKRGFEGSSYEDPRKLRRY